MFRALLVWLIACTMAIAISVVLIRFRHPFVLASAEARASLEVTESQLKELKGARALNDAISYAIIGASIALATALPLASRPRSNQPFSSRRYGGVALAIALGLIAGSIGGYLANLFEDQTSWNLDSTSRMSLLLTIAIAPVAVVIGGVAGLLRGSPQAISDSIMAAVLGAGATIVCIAVLHGTATPFEAHPPVLPDQPANRILVAAAMIFCPSLAILLRSFSESGRKTPKDDHNVA